MTHDDFRNKGALLVDGLAIWRDSEAELLMCVSASIFVFDRREWRDTVHLVYMVFSN